MVYITYYEFLIKRDKANTTNEKQQSKKKNMIVFVLFFFVSFVFSLPPLKTKQPARKLLHHFDE